MDKILMVVIKETGDKRIASQSGGAEPLSLLLARIRKYQYNLLFNVKERRHCQHLIVLHTNIKLLSKQGIYRFCINKPPAVLLLAIIIQDCSHFSLQVFGQRLLKFNKSLNHLHYQIVLRVPSALILITSLIVFVGAN